MLMDGVGKPSSAGLRQHFSWPSVQHSFIQGVGQGPSGKRKVLRSTGQGWSENFIRACLWEEKF
jgi:hypothetical protein